MAPATAARRAGLVVGYLLTVAVVGWLLIGTYALAVVGFVVGFAVLLLAIRAVHVWATNGLRRHVENALAMPVQRRVS